jgi:hypothetical protein
MTEYVCTGPDGGNLLGFLCSLGIFAIMERRWPSGHPRMRWERGDRWRPILSHDGETPAEEFISAMYEELKARRDSPEFKELEKLPTNREAFRAFALSAARRATPVDHTMADFVVAFGCESAGGEMVDTALRIARSHEFLRFISNAHDVTLKQVREATFGPWAYKDNASTLRYDPLDDRQFALRGRDPTESPTWCVKAANAFASEALRFFPVAPGSGETTGFFSGAFSWPLWTVPISPDVLRCLLGHPDVVADRPNQATLQAMGVAEVYRSRRVTNDKYRNFTPAHPV